MTPYPAPKILAVLLILCLCPLTPHSLAQSGNPAAPNSDDASYVVFDFPFGASLSSASIVGMNDKGYIAGILRDQNGNQHGYVRDAQGSFTIFDAPSAVVTDVSAINNFGEITGQLIDTGNNFRGFLRNAQGNFTVFDPPNSGDTAPTSINNKGEIAGEFADTTQHRGRGFIRDAEGNFTIFDATPDTHDTTPYSINEAGDTAGVSLSSDQAQSFVRDSQGGLIVFDTSAISEAPNVYLGTFGQHINNAGEITGNIRIALHRFRGFVRDPQGDITIFDAPNAEPNLVNSIPGTLPKGINDAGQVVGSFSDAIQRQSRGFVRDRQGNFTVFDPPNSGGTVATAINNQGQIAGLFSDVTQGGNQRGFLRFPNAGRGQDGQSPSQ